jgi:hypothetical protein
MFIILTLNHAPKNIYIRTDDPNLPVFYFDPLICVHSYQPPSLASYEFAFSHTCSFSELLVCPGPLLHSFLPCLLVLVHAYWFSFLVSRFHFRSLTFTPAHSFSHPPARFHACPVVFMPADSFLCPLTRFHVHRLLSCAPCFCAC